MRNFIRSFKACGYLFAANIRADNIRNGEARGNSREVQNSNFIFACVMREFRQ